MPDIIGYALYLLWSNNAVLVIAADEQVNPGILRPLLVTPPFVFPSNSVFQVVVIFQVQAQDVPFRQSNCHSLCVAEPEALGVGFDGDVVYAKGAVSSIYFPLWSKILPHHPVHDSTHSCPLAAW